MPFQIRDLSRNSAISATAERVSVLLVPGQYQDIKSALTVAKKGSIIELSTGTYSEDVALEDGITLLSNSEARIAGTVVMKGSGKISGVECEHLIVQGDRIGHDIIVSKTLAVISGTFTCVSSELNCDIKVDQSSIIIRNCTVTAPRLALEITEGEGLIENSYLDGTIKLGKNTVLSCLQVQIYSDKNLDLIETLDETTTVQLFNCIATGNAKIKSGHGTSMRSNLIALGKATELVDGENILIQPI